MLHTFYLKLFKKYIFFALDISEIISNIKLGIADDSNEKRNGNEEVNLKKLIFAQNRKFQISIFKINLRQNKKIVSFLSTNF